MCKSVVCMCKSSVQDTIMSACQTLHIIHECTPLASPSLFLSPFSSLSLSLPSSPLHLSPPLVHVALAPCVSLDLSPPPSVPPSRPHFLYIDMSLSLTRTPYTHTIHAHLCATSRSVTVRGEALQMDKRSLPPSLPLSLSLSLSLYLRHGNARADAIQRITVRVKAYLPFET